jgi:hypothetical protein
MGTWTNNDGLYIRFGTDEAVHAKGGDFRPSGGKHITEVEITATSLGTAAAILDNTVTIPAGARIEKVEVVAETACTSGGAAVLNVGLIDQDRTTAIDADGLVAALALASINVVGELNTLSVGVTGAGALVGTTLTNAGLLTADYDTAAFTAGVVVVRVHWYKP